MKRRQWQENEAAAGLLEPGAATTMADIRGLSPSVPPGPPGWLRKHRRRSADVPHDRGLQRARRLRRTVPFPLNGLASAVKGAAYDPGDWWLARFARDPRGNSK